MEQLFKIKFYKIKKKNVNLKQKRNGIDNHRLFIIVIIAGL